MKGTDRKWLSGLILGACLGTPGGAFAGPLVNLMQPCDCPPNHYSAMHVLTPTFYRWAAWCHGPCRYTFVKDNHPDVPPTVNFNPYHCPAVNPLQFSMDHYVGLSGGPPRSTYQPPRQPERASPYEPGTELQQPRKESQPGAPQLLPPPREEPEKK
jgi:hypothetical protein